jgi:hypothetical protein
MTFLANSQIRSSDLFLGLFFFSLIPMLTNRIVFAAGLIHFLNAIYYVSYLFLYQSSARPIPIALFATLHGLLGLLMVKSSSQFPSKFDVVGKEFSRQTSMQYRIAKASLYLDAAVCMSAMILFFSPDYGIKGFSGSAGILDDNHLLIAQNFA